MATPLAAREATEAGAEVLLTIQVETRLLKAII
jgi:hypothetical protein